MDIIKPKLPELPQIDESTITFKKSTLIIILSLAMLSIIISTYFMTSKPPNVKDHLTVYCEGPKSSVIKNNIQASHAYTERISEKNNSLETLICIKADDQGSLWGNSMQPTFFEGNTLLTKNYNSNITLHTGDLIRYFRFNDKYPNCTAIVDANANNSLGGSWINNSMAVIHRISAIYDDAIVTQGDNINQIETINRCQITDLAVGIIFT